MAGCLDGILRVSGSLCRGGLRNPLVCVGLSRGEVGGGRGGVVVRDWGGGGVDGLVGGSLVSSLVWGTRQYGGPVTSGRCRVVGLSVIARSLLSVVARSWVVVALSSRSPRWILIALSSVCKSRVLISSRSPCCPP